MQRLFGRIITRKNEKNEKERNRIEMMRIITGKARGVRLATLEGQNTRPTSERAKEAIFSMIQFEIRNAEVLDLFAGSGDRKSVV